MEERQEAKTLIESEGRIDISTGETRAQHNNGSKGSWIRNRRRAFTDPTNKDLFSSNNSILLQPLVSKHTVIYSAQTESGKYIKAPELLPEQDSDGKDGRCFIKHWISRNGSSHIWI